MHHNAMFAGSSLKTPITSLSLVIPIYNEEAIIPELYRRIAATIENNFQTVSVQIIFVDDGSTDHSLSLLEKLHEKDGRIRILAFSRNFGHHIAVTAGLDFADGDATVLMDGDLQDRPEDIPALIQTLEGGFDLVYAARKGNDSRGTLIAKLGSRVFVRLMRKIVREPMAIGTSMFRAMRNNVVEEVRKLRERNRFIIGLIDWAGFRQTSIVVERDERFAGPAKYRFMRRMRLALDAIFSFSTLPLQIAGAIGLLVTVFSFVFGVYVMLRKIFWGFEVSGFASITVSMFFLGGAELMMLGLLGAYIGRIYTEVKQRPLYIIKKIIG